MRGVELDPFDGHRQEATRKSIWPAIYPELLELVREHRSTIVFVNNRRGAERLALRLNELADEHDRPRAPRLARARGAAGGRGPCSRPASCRAWSPPRRSSSASTWARSTSCCRSSRRSRSPPGCSGSAAPATASARSRRAASSPSSAPTCSSARSSPSACARARSRRPSCRATRSTCSPSRSSRWPRPPSDDERSPSTTCTRWSRAPTRTPSCRARSSRTCSTCSTAATRRRSSASCAPRIVWDRVAGHDPRAQGRARAGGHQRRHDPRPRAVRRQPPRRPPRRRARRGDGLRGAARARRSCSARRRWRIEEITRDRVIVTPAPGVPGAVPFWKGDGVGRPRELGEAIGAFARWAVDQDRRDAGARLRPRRARGPQPARLPARAAGGDARRAERPHDRDRALPRRDRRLAAVRAVARSAAACTPPGALALSRPHPRRVRPRVRRDLVRRRHHRPPARRRRAARRRPRADRPRRARGPRRRRAGRLRAVRRALPRERRPRAADPARVPGQAHAAVAAAAEGAVAARGGQALRAVPDRARDLPRVPARRARPARPAASCCAAAHARALAGRGRDADRLAVRLLAAVRLRRHLHVRGRHAQRRAARGGARRSTATCCASCSGRRSCAS